jgi:hypothetical protein
MVSINDRVALRVALKEKLGESAAFTFSTSTVPEKQHALKKRFTAKSKKSKKSKKGEKKRPKNKNFFDLAVILPPQSFFPHADTVPEGTIVIRGW